MATALVFSGCGDNTTANRTTLAQVMPDVSNADPRLVAITKQASQILSGGEPAFQARMQQLRGLPIVVNKWASWCHPCVAEAAVFQ